MLVLFQKILQYGCFITEFKVEGFLPILSIQYNLLFSILLIDFISLPTISDMKIDAIDRRIYYTDNSNKEVASISLDGRDYKMVINTGPSSLPRALVVVPSLRYPYLKYYRTYVNVTIIKLTIICSFTVRIECF